MARSIEHIGVAVTDLEHMIAILEAFGFKVTHTKTLAGGDTSHTLSAGDSAFDLLRPGLVDGRLGRFIEQHGPGLHHVCLRVESLSAAVATADRLGLPHTPIGDLEDVDGSLVFIHPKATQGVLLGLFQSFRSAAVREGATEMPREDR